MSTPAKLMTVKELQDLPHPENGHYELHHGKLCFMTFPKAGHEKLQERLRGILAATLTPAWVVRVEMAFRPLPEYELRVADVGVLARKRDEEVDPDDYLQGAPDLVVEVLSRSNTAEGLKDLRDICLESGCRSFWVVDSKRRIVSVTELGATRHYTLHDDVSSTALGHEIRFSLQELFT